MQGLFPLKTVQVQVCSQDPESAAAADRKKAHKGIKATLSNCVMSAMRYNAHFKAYYKRNRTADAAQRRQKQVYCFQCHEEQPRRRTA